MRRLLNQDVVRHVKNKSKMKSDPSAVIFQQGKPVDFFVLILEGRVEVTVGKENLMFEGGPLPTLVFKLWHRTWVSIHHNNKAVTAKLWDHCNL